MNRLITILTLYSCLLCPLMSQESLGLHMDNYSGTDLMFWNPANAMSPANKWDITIGSAHIFGFTDYAFLRNSSLFNIAEDARLAQVITTRSAIPTDNETSPVLIFDEDFGNKNFAARANISWPSISVRINDKWRIGLFLRTRFHITAPNIPESLGLYELSDARFVNLSLELSPVRGAGLTWFESGVHISKQISKEWSVGTNIKAQFSTEALFVESDTNGSLSINPETLNQNGSTINASIGYISLFQQGADSRIDPISHFDNNSLGFGIDIGVRLTKKNWSVGASIIDLGYISFTDKGDLVRLTNSTQEIRFEDYEQIRDFNDVIDQIKLDFGINTDFRNNSTYGLPTGLILQGSLKVKKAFNISGQITQRIPIFANSISRENSIAMIPHYSTKWVSVFTPITLYDFKRFRLGLAARLAFITIGSDQLGTFFRSHDFRGSDLYIKISFSPDQADRFKKAIFKPKKKSKAKCFKF